MLDADGSHWSFQGVAESLDSLLWEAVPSAFVERHPGAGIEESYGQPATAIPCLDFWFYLESDRVVLSWEGYGFVEESHEPSGDGDADGRALAARLAAHLRVALPGTSGGT
ncbi:hypothetical protein [Nocardioides piscis]|uniref:Uncharacterized protein n=1 Tax=Nocardioides piscis TaxID=2714938 RepID=A0A6G7YJP1_9ACTN|nr:hypothetical protein [Nocardioides piscis]QIK76955.1 hypothetical protein G7071_17460 [Nocardioides piscis]